MHGIGGALLLVAGIFVVAQIVMRLARRVMPRPAPPLIAPLLASPMRRWIQPPDAVIRRSGVGAGMIVLEVGCGNGVMTAAAARAAGGTGRVVALDVQTAMLHRLMAGIAKPQGRAAAAGIEPVAGDARALPFAGGSFDLVLMVASLAEVPNTHEALLEAGRVLSPGGVLAVTEFLPDPDYPLRSTTISCGERAGFCLKSVSGNFFDYTVCFEKL
jgi:ubiquinone/menaquinone biosynthesis C-methylase UbiE